MRWGKDSDTNNRRGALWYTGLAATNTERPAVSSVLTDKEWVWMAVS
jgi:hypothetical protein